MKFGIVVFPGTLSDGDCYHVAKTVLGQDTRYVWHKDRDVSGLDCLVLPGGFSYGDYLRTGAIARFSPVMEEVASFANRGGLVIGICNGFQILCEAGLLPGVLTRNHNVQFRCQWVDLRVENPNTSFTSGCGQDQVLRIPISHGEGNYYADPDTLASLNAKRQIAFRYSTPQGEITTDANPNGSLENIAGIVNDRGNVLGMMPHPERCCEEALGGTDGRIIFESMMQVVV
jgi:phosphoribosylformylglycinamidine synthase I